VMCFLFFFQAEDGIRGRNVTGVQTCALPILIGSLVTALVISSALANGTNSNAAANGSSGSGDIIIAWNKELLKIVKTPGAQPTKIGRASCRERVSLAGVAASAWRQSGSQTVG